MTVPTVLLFYWYITLLIGFSRLMLNPILFFSVNMYRRYSCRHYDTGPLQALFIDLMSSGDWHASVKTEESKTSWWLMWVRCQKHDTLYYSRYIQDFSSQQNDNIFVTLRSCLLTKDQLRPRSFYDISQTAKPKHTLCNCFHRLCWTCVTRKQTRVYNWSGSNGMQSVHPKLRWCS